MNPSRLVRDGQGVNHLSPHAFHVSNYRARLNGPCKNRETQSYGHREVSSLLFMYIYENDLFLCVMLLAANAQPTPSTSQLLGFAL